jgi:hypothetical protein
MGLLRDVGKFAGQAAGFVVGGAVNVVGELTGSTFVKEVGDGIKKTSEFTGDIVGQVVDGTWNTASGLIQDDKNKVNHGLNDMGASISRTAKRVVNGAKYTFNNGKDIYVGLRDNDNVKIKNGVRSLAKTAAIGALSISVIDLVDGIDGVHTGNFSDNGDLVDIHADQIDTPVLTDTGDHFVHPHLVRGHWQNGHWIESYWRDGDGDTSVDLNETQGGGYFQSNPNGDTNDNLG